MARQIDFFDGAQSSTTPTIGNITASDLIEYANDAAYEAAEQGSPTTGNIYYNTTDNVIRYYDVGETAWRSILPSDPEDTILVVKDDVDNTKTFRFEASGITTATLRVMTIPDQDGTLVLEAGTQTLTNKTIVVANNTITTAASGNLTSTELDAALAELQTDVDTRIPSAEKAAANGVATLDGSSKIPIAQIPDALIGAVVYQGSWNASTNTPTLSDGTGTQGHYYITTVAGTQDLGSGNITFDIGDWAIHNGSTWDKVDNVDPADTDALPEGATNLYYTEARVSANTDVTANTAKVSAAGSIDTHSDVDVTTTPPVINNVLQYDGSNFVPGMPCDIMAVTSQAANYTVLATDDLVLMDSSGGTLTVDLPTAVGNTGKVFDIKKVSSDLNAITIDANASETIDGNLTTTINTENENLRIVSDGANWEILDRKARTAWTLYSVAIGGTSSNPTLGSTSINEAHWRRVGDSVEIRFHLDQTTAGTAGSGAYLINLPSGMTADSTKITPSTAAFNTTVGSAAMFDGTNVYAGSCALYDVNNVAVCITNATSTGYWGNSIGPLSTADTRVSLIATVPITGWKA